MSFVSFVVVIIVLYILYTTYGKRVMDATGMSTTMQTVWRFLGYCDDPGNSPPRELALWVLPWYFAYQINEIDNNLYPQHADKIVELRDTFYTRASDILKKINDNRRITNDKLIDQWNVKTNAYNECRKVKALELQANAVSSSVTVVVNSTANHLGPWLALIVMILTIILFSVFVALSYRSSGNSGGSSSNSSSNLFFLNWLHKIFKKHTKRFALKHSEDGQARPSNGGRCGSEWIADVQGNSNMCLNTASPPDIKTKFYEKDSAVYIPWLVQDTFFVPQCESSYIIDKDGNKQPTDKKYYIDGGLTCTPNPNPGK